MISKPAIAGNEPIIVTTSQTVSESVREVVAIHYVNTTGGAGRVTVRGTEVNKGVILGSDASGGNDSFEPAQPMRFDKIIVTFDTGTGFVSILTN